MTIPTTRDQYRRYFYQLHFNKMLDDELISDYRRAIHDSNLYTGINNYAHTIATKDFYSCGCHYRWRVYKGNYINKELFDLTVEIFSTKYPKSVIWGRKLPNNQTAYIVIQDLIY